MWIYVSLWYILSKARVSISRHPYAVLFLKSYRMLIVNFAGTTMQTPVLSRCASAVATAATAAIFLAVLQLGRRSHALENGLSRTPPMGWLAWERFRCNTDW